MIERIETIEVPRESLVDDIACELVQVEQGGGFVGWTRFAMKKGSDPFFRGVVYLHGIQSHGGWFLRSCDYLRKQGMAVLAPDRRGSGLNRQNRGHCDSPKQLLEDVDCCVDWLRAKTGLEKVDIVAVSWSGKLALVYAAQQPAKVRSVVLVAPGLKARVDISLAEKIKIGAEGLLQPKKRHEIPLNDPKLFTANPAMLQFLENDPLKLTEATASFFITSRRLDMQVPKIGSKLTMPVYLFLAEHDRIIDNEATIELLKPVLKEPNKSSESAKIYKGAHHTLDFEAEPGEFFADLGKVILEDVT
jgi:alpha-beta hydrolase superfamily lysophospholipase